MNRIVEPELLDELPATDPRAIQSRRDLRRINALMRNAATIRRFLEQAIHHPPLTIAEIGSGDGNISTQVVAHFTISGRLILIDQQPIACSQTSKNWTVQLIQSDIFEWFRTSPQVDVIIANLFLHHFQDERLRELLAAAAQSCRCFVACEPRRDSFAHWFSRRVNLIGCNEVTANDAAISVRAGFRDSELSQLWPKNDHSKLTERRAGLFTHFFGAVRA
jgi:hypothetical protein